MNNRCRQKRKLNKYSFSEQQVWNADDTMVSFILPLLKAFKKSNRHTYPGRDEADTPEKWEAILDHLIYTFDQMDRDYPDSPHNKASKKMEREHPDCWEYESRKEPNGMHSMKFKHDDIFDRYFTEEVNQKEKEYQNYIQEGLFLFAKYFRDLWD